LADGPEGVTQVQTSPIRLARSVVGRREADAVARVLLEDGYLGMGREVQLFEEELAAFLGVERQHVIAVNSGTAALHLAVQAVARPGDEVLVQSLTFVATYQAISAAGAVPVSCDVVPETVTIDLADAERRLTPNTRAIMPVHYAGTPAGVDAVHAFAARHRLRVIEDAAHAFGSRAQGRLVGTFGDIACFSYDGIKNITSGEGGLVVTRDAAVAGKISDARLLGVEHDTERRFAGERSWEFDVTAQGYRYHMSNVLAAIGRVQLQRFATEFAPRRQALARRYRERFATIPGVALLDADLTEVVPHMQPIRVLGGRRDGLRQHLREAGIPTGIHYKPNHLLTRFGGGDPRLPVTERLYEELLTLPLHPELDDSIVDAIGSEVERWLAQSGEGR
jgi:dTDP-4-amino-4,6-dideoxygalactose transaminase